MKNHTNQELREMSLDDAVAELQNAVYAATSLIERRVLRQSHNRKLG